MNNKANKRKTDSRSLLSYFEKKVKSTNESVTNNSNQDKLLQPSDKILNPKDGNLATETGSTFYESNSGTGAIACDPKKSEYNFMPAWSCKYKWLIFNKEKGGAFCTVCSKYYQNNADILQKTKGIFINTPFTNYRKATGVTGKLSKHDSSEYHKNEMAKENLSILHKNKPVHTILIQQSSEEVDKNRAALKILIRSLYFLVKGEIAHTTKYESIIKNLMAPCVENLDTWLQRQSERATYCSKDTACEMLECMSDVLSEDIAADLKGKPFALMADESTNTANQSELSICIRYVTDNHQIQERFLCVTLLEDTTAETITKCIEQELSKRDLSFDNIVACGFDGGSNFSGSISGVHKRISDRVGRTIPYIHCRAHVLSLAIVSTRNKFAYVKRFFYTVKDIYKIFHQSPKRESALHEIQKMLQDPVLKIPEATDVRWLSHFKTINAIKRSYGSIMMTLEHLHKDGADLASLAGGILLEMEKSSFLLTLCLLVEILGAVSNLSKILQKQDCQLSMLPQLISATTTHLKSISEDIQNAAKERPSNVISAYEDLKIKVSEIRKIKCDISEHGVCLKMLEKFTAAVVTEMEKRFNKQAMELVSASSFFESFNRIQAIEDSDVKNLCQILNIPDIDHVLADIKLFKFLAANVTNAESPLKYVLQSSIGYDTLKNLSIRILTVPVSTASVERTFSTMNRIMSPLRNRLGGASLDHCMRISIEGADVPSEDFLSKTLNCYATKRQRRIRLLH